MKKSVVDRIHALQPGRYKVWQMRIQGYLGIGSFVMLLYLYISQMPLGVPWYGWVGLLAVLIPIIVVFDIIFVWPSEMTYGFEKNPEMVKMRREIHEIKEMLKNQQATK